MAETGSGQNLMRGPPGVGDHGAVSAPTDQARPAPAALGSVPGPGEVPPRRLYRDSGHRVFGGVVSGLVAHLGLEGPRARWAVRAAFVALTFSGGFGLVLYGAFWIVLPLAPGAPVRRRPLWMHYVGAALAAGVVIAVVVTTKSISTFFVPIVLAGLGGALVWRQAADSQREKWTRISASSLNSGVRDRNGAIRLVAGAAMVVIGGVLVVTRGAGVDQVLGALVLVLIVAIGFALITGPLWVRIAGELSAERRALIRAQERADLAAHVHDSVLQTLALIQRNADLPREVTRLARGQERELRTLLYGQRTMTGQYAAAVHDLVGEVEDNYAISVDSVVVGDAPLDAVLDAVVQATREAMVNAAKHANVERVSLFTEVETDEVVVYVRDRGLGFDPAAVADDRRGLRGSIIDRIERHGGTVRVRSGPDTGTEVELRVRR